MSLSDGHGGRVSSTLLLHLASGTLTPLVRLGSDHVIDFVQGMGHIPVAASAAIVDASNASYGGGSLALRVLEGSEEGDALGILIGEPASSGFTLRTSGTVTNLYYRGELFGTVSVGAVFSPRFTVRLVADGGVGGWVGVGGCLNQQRFLRNHTPSQARAHDVSFQSRNEPPPTHVWFGLFFLIIARAHTHRQ